MKTSITTSLLAILAGAISACESFLTIDPPETELIKSTVFNDDGTAKAALAGVYNQMSFTGFASGDVSSVTFLASLSSDELTNYAMGSLGQEFQQFNSNVILPVSSRLNGLWSKPYQTIYQVNALLEGMDASNGLSAEVRNQLEGEAKFIRAFHYFYLLNLFGDVPLITTTAWEANATASRTSAAAVYELIIRDLEEARALLPETYSGYGNERVRPNRDAATALLARVHLYVGDWVNAEAMAAEVITHTDLYELLPPEQVFLKNSREAIWQLMRNKANTWEAGIFYLTNAPRYAALTSTLVNAFEAGDERRNRWVGMVDVNGTTYFFAAKYKTPQPSPIVEYSMVLRLAEQYLIRAEANAHQDKITEALADLDVLRSRAGLPAISETNPSISADDLLLAIEHERRVELFTEWGHRWLDLKRTDRADAVLSPLKENWKTTAALYPIPLSQLQNDPAMADAQNPGY